MRHKLQHARYTVKSVDDFRVACGTIRRSVATLTK